MDFQLSDRVKGIKPSPTLAVAAKARQLKAAGKDIVGLGTGEPDFDTPEHIKEAAIQAIRDGATKYTPVDGTVALKQAIIEKFDRDNSLQYEPDQILVSCGGKQSFYNLCQAYLNPGDEVVIPAPYWVSYPDMALLAGGKPVFINTTLESELKITPEQLEAAITPQTRLMVLNSPSNPSGKAYTKRELVALAEVLMRHPRVLIATDDMYEHIIWTEEGFWNIVNACPDLEPRTIVLNGVSKAYAMTGWRIGYAGGSKHIIQAMKKIQSQSTSNPAAPSQAAAQAAISGDQSCIKPMLKTFHERHDKVVVGLNAIDGISCLPSDGTFYAFPNMEPLIAKHGCQSDMDFAELLLSETGLALVPGTAFGTPGHLRLSYAASDEMLDSALERLAKMA